MRSGRIALVIGVLGVAAGLMVAGWRWVSSQTGALHQPHSASFAASLLVMQGVLRAATRDDVNRWQAAATKRSPTGHLAPVPMEDSMRHNLHTAIKDVKIPAGLHGAHSIGIISFGAVIDERGSDNSHNRYFNGLTGEHCPPGSRQEPECAFVEWPPQAVAPPPKRPAETTAPLPENCRLAAPKDAKVVAFGAYQGGSASTIELKGNQGHRTRQTPVSLDAAGDAVFLVLAAYDPVVWAINPAAVHRIRGVVVFGYHSQAIANLPPSVPSLILTYIDAKASGCPAIYAYAYQGGKELERMDGLVASITGRHIEQFSGSYNGTGFPLGDPGQPKAVPIDAANLRSSVR
jgi:hypothetical protein